MSQASDAQGLAAAEDAAARSASPSAREIKKEGMRMADPDPSSAISGSAHWQPGVE
jgi:hypothetical protein